MTELPLGIPLASSIPVKHDRDPLNLDKLWPSSNDWGIPDLPATDFIPACLEPFNEKCSPQVAADNGGALHFYLDDYRFERVWNQPERALERVARAGAAITPDFSTWFDSPRAVNIWQTYRARWCGAYWAIHGVHVIPNVSLGPPQTWDYIFAGLPVGSVLALAAFRSLSGDTLRVFRIALREMVNRLEPIALVVYGRMPEVDFDLPPVQEHPTFWERKRECLQKEAARTAAGLAGEAAVAVRRESGLVSPSTIPIWAS